MWPLKVCYLSTGILDTAFNSQVLPLLMTASCSGFDLMHISVEPFRQKFTNGYMERRAKVNSMGIKTLYFRQAPPVSRTSLMIDKKRIFPAFRKWWGGHDRVVIHCRGHLNTFRGLILKRIDPERMHLIADLRGAIADEALQGQGGMLKHLLRHYLSGFYRGVENEVARKSDKILCVSNAFRNFLETEYDVGNVSIIPSYVDTSRFNFSKSTREFCRTKLGISNRVVLVYSGGVAPWQRVDSVIQFFIGMRQRIENLFMLFLSHEPFAIREMLKGKIKSRDVQVIQVPHDEVASYLCAADVGILLRENALTNRVASPIKFSEYMCCGLPCIISEGIGDTEEAIAQGNSGIVLRSQRDLPSVVAFQKLLSIDREGISKSMGEKYSSRVYLPKIKDIYRGLAE